MESEDADVCVWCRRAVPPSSASGRNWGAWLQQEDDSDIGNYGYWPLVGVGVFLVALVIGWVAIGSPIGSDRAPQAKKEVKPELAVWSGMGPNGSLLKEDSPVAVTASVSSVPNPVSQPGRFAPIPQNSRPSVPQPGGTPSPTQAASATMPMKDGDIGLTGAYVSEATLKLNDLGGKFQLEGSVGIMNLMNQEVTDLVLVLKSDAGQLSIPLEQTLRANRMNVIRFTADDVQPGLAQSKSWRLSFQGKVGDDRIDGEFDLKSKQ
jgi:hypothetical protein